MTHMASTAGPGATDVSIMKLFRRHAVEPCHKFMINQEERWVR